MLGGLFTYIMTAVGTLYGWRNPFIGLMIYYGFAVLRPAYLWEWAWGGPENAAKFSQMVAISTVIGWVINGFGDWKGLRPIALPMIGLLVYLLCGVFGAVVLAPRPDVAWLALDTIWKIVLMAMLTVSLVRERWQIKTMAWVVAACLCYQAYHFNTLYLQDPRFPWYLSEGGFGGIDNNGVAMTMVMAVPLAFFLAVVTRNWIVRGLCLFGAACAIHVVLFSYSRGGQLGLVIVGAAILIVALIRLPNKILTVTAVSLMAWLTLELAGEQIRTEFFSIFVEKEKLDASASSRFDTWAGGWACMKANPLGVGPRNFNVVSHLYGLPHNKSVHNLFLQTGADYGFLGMFGLATFYFGALIQSFRISRTKTAKRLVWPSFFGQMCVVSLTGFLICSTFIGMEAVETGYMVGLIGLCTVAYVRRVEAEEPAVQLVLPEMVEVPEDWQEVVQRTAVA